jgi:uncharacterized membrane protein YgcG
MKPLAAAAALVIAVAAGFAPAQARDSYVIDNAQLLSPATVSAINAKVGDFNAQAHKEVVVVIQPSFTGTPADAEERTFAQQQVNGVLIFIAKSPKTIAVVPDRAAAHYFPAGTTSAIRQAIASAFNSGDFNGGVTNGVDLTLAEYRSHLGSVRTTTFNSVPATTVRNDTGGGFNMSLIWWLIALAVIFFVVRGIFRAIAGPRMMPPGYGGGMGGPMGGGYGPGYGGGGFGGGGGGFWSGMLGGLGGAFLGNELFGGGRNEMFNQGGQQAGFGDGGQGQYGGGDPSGFQNDAGQADMGNASSGGWGGDSGGGGGWGDTGGGGGDFGGGGGGGGGDGGGGW